MGSILYGIAVVLVVLWLIGLVVHITFAAIHLLLVVAVILIIYNFVMGRRNAV
jgi:hypothetical protein